MATNNAAPNQPSDLMEYFNRVSAHIRKVFNQLLALLFARKEALLRKVSMIRDEYQSRENARQDEYRRVQNESNASGNVPSDSPNKMPHIIFQYPNLDRLQTLIKEFGEFFVWKTPNYSQKNECILATGGEGTKIGEFRHPRGLAIDEINKNIFIADCGNCRIQKYSYEGNFISQSDQDFLNWPWGICVFKNYVFVTDIKLQALLKIDKNTLQLVSKVGAHGKDEGQLESPNGLTVDLDGNVYIADSLNDRVSVFTVEPKFAKCFGRGNLKTPQDVKLTITSESVNFQILVLDLSPNCMRIFSRNGDFLGSCISQGMLEECDVVKPFFFCLDFDQNIIISDYDHYVIKVFSKSGEYIHTIGGKGEERGKFRSPYGIAISYRSGIIFVVSENFNFALQAF